MSRKCEHRTLSRLLIAACTLAIGQGCFLLNGTEEDAGTDAETGVSSDASNDGSDGSGDASGDPDAGLCEPFGTTRLCDPYCAARCPPERNWCSEVYYVCQATESTDPRGREDCIVHVALGGDYCYTGRRFCLTSDRFRPTDASWGGTCVDEQLCSWVMEQSELEHLRCRYSEGTLYEDGPPEAPCGDGAPALSPFCGGRCGDTCASTACVGISETRAFGVCVPTPRPRCWLDSPLPNGVVEDCERRGGRPCACMVLSPVELPEWASSGWPVFRDSCLAYQRHYPDEVRCYDRNLREL